MPLALSPVALGVSLALVIGVVLGLLGGGGGILTVPMLVYVLHVDPKQAVVTSLLVVGATSLVGLVPHARSGAVQWRTGLVFGLAAMAGGYAGGKVAGHLPGRALLMAFGGMMIASAFGMLRGRSVRRGGSFHWLGALVLGALVGAIAGLVGTGGGFLIVPALALVGGLDMREAIGTSLFVIALQCFGGLVGHGFHVTLERRLVLGIVGAGMLGSLIGAAVGKRVATEHLRQAFAYLVITMGVFIFSTQLEF